MQFAFAMVMPFYHLLQISTFEIILFTWLPCFEEEEIRKCSCSCDRVVFVRKDIFELEALSKKFEEEIGVLDEVGKWMSQSDGSSTHPLLIRRH